MRRSFVDRRLRFRTPTSPHPVGAGFHARPAPVDWRRYCVAPTSHQPLSHAASRRDSSPFRGAEGWADILALYASVSHDAATYVSLPPVRGGVLDAPRSSDRRAALDAPAQRDQQHQRLIRCARQHPPPHASNPAGTARAPFFTGARRCPLSHAGRAWKPSPTVGAKEQVSAEPLGALPLCISGLGLRFPFRGVLCYHTAKSLWRCVMERTKRVEMLQGGAAAERLMRSRVAVVGLGGVGSWCAEALCRSGIGSLTLIDSDLVAESNINRQLEALGSTVGAAQGRSPRRAAARHCARGGHTARSGAVQRRKPRRPAGRPRLRRRLHRPRQLQARPYRDRPSPRRPDNLRPRHGQQARRAAPAYNRPGRDLRLPLRARHAPRAPPARDRAPRRCLLGRARARLRAA